MEPLSIQSYYYLPFKQPDPGVLHLVMYCQPAKQSQGNEDYISKEFWNILYGAITLWTGSNVNLIQDSFYAVML